MQGCCFYITYTSFYPDRSKTTGDHVFFRSRYDFIIATATLLAQFRAFRTFGVLKTWCLLNACDQHALFLALQLFFPFQIASCRDRLPFGQIG
jgi:hypothetical protein